MSIWHENKLQVSVLRLGAVLCASTMIAACNYCGGASPVGTLTQIKPSVTLSRADQQPVAVVDGSPLFAGDVLTADAQGSAVLQFSNGARIFLQASSAFIVEAENNQRSAKSVRLLFGNIEAEGLEDSLIINTKMGAIRFGQESSRVRVQASGQNIRVKTLLGQISMGDEHILKGVSVQFSQAGIVFEKEDAGYKSADAAIEDAADVNDLGEITALVIQLKSGRGVFRQVGGRGRFRALKTGVQVAKGDVVEARRGSATIQLGGLGELRLKKGGQVSIGDKNNLFDLRKGQGQILLNKGEQRRISVGGADLGVYAKNSAALVEFIKRGHNSHIQVRDGQVEFTDKNGQQWTLMTNDKLSINKKGQAIISHVRNSVLVVTAQIKRLFLAGRIKNMTFKWKAQKNSEVYQIEISRKADYSEAIASSTVKKNTLTIKTLPYGLYYWRVKSADTILAEAKIRIAKDRTSIQSSARKNTVRASGERTIILYQQYKAPQLTFLWPAQKGVSHYKVSVYRDGDFNKAVIERESQKSQINIPSGQLDDGKYVWAYTSLDAKGQNLATSDMYDLEIRFDSNKVLLRVISPKVGARCKASRMATTGLVAPGAKLKINNKTVKVDAAGRFSATAKVERRRPILLYQVGRNLFARALRR